MIIHADGPIYGYHCEDCNGFWFGMDHFSQNPSHQMVPVMPITAVHAMRCLEHRTKPAMNWNAGNAECGYCGRAESA